MKIISHPKDPSQGRHSAELLKDHHHQVANRIRDVLSLSVTTPDGTPLIDIAEIAAGVHDIGKATPQFQTYLRSTSHKSPHTHAPFGGLVTFYVLTELGYSKNDALLGLLTTAKHHGPLPKSGVFDYIRDYFVSQQSGVRGDEWRDIRDSIQTDENTLKTCTSIIKSVSDGALTFEDFAAALGNEQESPLLENIGKSIRPRATFNNESTLDPPEGFYPSLLQIWSSVCLADKTLAANVDDEYLTGVFPTVDEVDNYISNIPPAQTPSEERVYELRQNARADVQANTEKFIQSGNNVATITLPTGVGKTLTGVTSALQILNAQPPEEQGRLIYCLPYTSIIDQTADVLTDVFETNEFSPKLTIHHYLSDTATRFSETNTSTTESREIAKDSPISSGEQLIGESWRSGVVLSTFVQLFESIVGPRNAQSLKTPSLYNSVIILDEPQTLPFNWWPLIREVIHVLTTDYNATVICMTATQPALLEAGYKHRFKQVELVSDINHYFTAPEITRVRYHFDPSVPLDKTKLAPPKTYTDAATELIDSATGKNSSVLAICNTINSAQTLSQEVQDLLKSSTFKKESINERYINKIKESINDQSNKNEKEFTVEEFVSEIKDNTDDTTVHTITLTSRHRPKDRLFLIETAKKLSTANIPLLFISTQLIEAGVDISFRHVYRDFAPLDNIVQSAGRCNRSQEWTQGTVTIWQLDSEGRKHTPSEALYRSETTSVLSLTANALAETITPTEPVLQNHVDRTAVRKYTEYIKETNPGDDTYVDAFSSSDTGVLYQLSLIETVDSVDILIPITLAEKQAVEQLWNNTNNPHTPISDTIQKLADIRVSIPIYKSTTEEQVTKFPALGDITNIRCILDTDSQHYSTDYGLLLVSNSL